jgi:hypothetical protein
MHLLTSRWPIERPSGRRSRYELLRHEIELSRMGVQHLERAREKVTTNRLKLLMGGTLLLLVGVVFALTPVMLTGNPVLVTYAVGICLSGFAVLAFAFCASAFLQVLAYNTRVDVVVGYLTTGPGGCHPKVTSSPTWRGRHLRGYVKRRSVGDDERELFCSMIDEWSGTTDELLAFIRSLRD